MNKYQFWAFYNILPVDSKKQKTKYILNFNSFRKIEIENFRKIKSHTKLHFKKTVNEIFKIFNFHFDVNYFSRRMKNFAGSKRKDNFF